MEVSVQITPLSYPSKESHRYNWRLGGSQSRSGRGVEDKLNFSLLRIKPRFPGSSARRLVSTVTELTRPFWSPL
jgi:hypothetical protein